jgi:hypothetical protein
MLDAKETQKRIIEIIRKRGPCLPIHLAKDLGISSLFISAFLSELAQDKKIRISNLKVGGSPLYFLEGQEIELEKFNNFLAPKENEAYLLLKKNRILKDSEQEPAIRVALRAIKDFAENFKNDNELYWRYISVTRQEVEDILIPKPKLEPKSEPKIETNIEPIEIIPIEKREQKEKEIIKKIPLEKEAKITSLEKKEKQKSLVIEFNNPLVIKHEEKPKKEKPKSPFVLRVKDFIQKKAYKIIEEKDYKPKEYLALVEINFELGPITFLTLSKDKKLVTDEDLIKLLSDAQRVPLPALIIYPENLSKKAKEFLEKYSSVIKSKKMD